MPESFHDTALLKKVREKARRFDFKGKPLSSSNFEEWTKEHGIDFVGSGNFSFVTTSPRDPEKVIAINYTTEEGTPAEFAKLQYYAQNIFHTLFPHNFPKWHLVVLEPTQETKDDRLSGTVRQRIRGTTLGNKEAAEVKYPFSTVFDFFQDYKLPFLFDPRVANFMVGNDGGEYYVDEPLYFYPEDIDAKKILQYMQDNNYPNKDIHYVDHAIKRMTEIKIP